MRRTDGPLFLDTEGNATWHPAQPQTTGGGEKAKLCE